MKVSAALFISTLAALANAIQLTDNNYNIQENQPFDITWSGAVGDVTITLKTGSSDNLKTVTTIASGVSASQFTWTPSNLPPGTYALMVTDSGGNSNYSPQFSYVGTGTLSVTASTASSTSTSASTSATVTSSTSTQSTSITTAANTTTTLTPISNSTTLTTSTSTSSSSSGSSSTASSTSSSASATGTKIPNTSDGHRLASSLALILGAVAAFAAFN